MTEIECDCIFCNFKCPECGSEEIEIKYAPVFRCCNDVEDNISIYMEEERLELICQKCGAWFDEDDLQSNKLDGLKKALRRELKITSNRHFEISDNMDIKVFETVAANTA